MYIRMHTHNITVITNLKIIRESYFKFGQANNGLSGQDFTIINLILYLRYVHEISRELLVVETVC